MHFIGMRRTWAVLGVLCVQSACTPVDQSEPWWLQVVSGADKVLDATFSEDGEQLTVVYLDGSGEPHLGRVKFGASPRTVEDLGPITFDGSVGTSQWATDTVDISLRPGTSEVWLYLDSKVARFPANTSEGTLVLNEPGADTGSLGFLDKDTLIYGHHQGLYLYPITGNGLGERKVIVEDALPLREVRQVLGVDGQIWSTPGGNGAVAFKSDGTPLPMGTEQFLGQPLMGSLGGAGWFNTSSAIGYCIVPRHPQGGARWPDSTSSKLDAGGCDNLDLPLSQGVYPFRRAELSRDGKRVALTTGARLFLASEGQPAAASSELEGTWCDTTGRSFTLSQGTLTLLSPPNTLDGSFKRATLSGSGSIRTVSLEEPEPYLAENIVLSRYDYFFKRVGNTLLVHGPVTREQAVHLRNGGYLNRSGLYLKGSDPSCTSLEP